MHFMGNHIQTFKLMSLSKAPPFLMKYIPAYVCVGRCLKQLKRKKIN